MKLERFVENQDLELRFTRRTCREWSVMQPRHYTIGSKIANKTTETWGCEIRYPTFDYLVVVETKTMVKQTEETVIEEIRRKKIATKGRTKKDCRDAVLNLIKGKTIIVKDLDGIRRIEVPSDLQ